MKASRNYLFVLFAFQATISISQVLEIPPRPSYVSEHDFSLGEAILKSANSQVKLANFNYAAADYWNYATAYLQMGQSKQVVFDFLSQSKQIDKLKFCQIAVHYHTLKGGIENTKFFKSLSDDYRNLVSDCTTF
jgi:hypothetical protein